MHYWKNTQTSLVLQLQVGTECTVTAFLVLVQTAEQFTLAWISFIYIDGELNLCRTGLQFPRVNLSECKHT